MKSIKARFSRESKRCDVSSYIAFVRAIKGQQFTRDTLSRNFIKLVEKDDYDKALKNALIDQLYVLSNPPVEHNKTK